MPKSEYNPLDITTWPDEKIDYELRGCAERLHDLRKKIELLQAEQSTVADLRSTLLEERDSRKPECPLCQIPGGPRHDGSPNCQCGSIASGGKRAHCSCDTCF